MQLVVVMAVTTADPACPVNWKIETILAMVLKFWLVSD